jgi:hypothetical protein
MSEILSHMYIGLHVKYRLFLSDCNENPNFSADFFNTGTSNFMKLCTMRAVLFHVDGQTGGHYETNKGKGLRQRAEVAQGVPGRLRPRILITFGTTRVVSRHPYAPAAFTPGTNPWHSFLEAESTPGHMVLSVTAEKKSPVIPLGIDPEIVALVARCLNHYATPGPNEANKLFAIFGESA